MVEEIEFDTEIKCQHVSQESCFESYTTTFKKTQVCFFTQNYFLHVSAGICWHVLKGYT